MSLLCRNHLVPKRIHQSHNRSTFHTNPKESRRIMWCNVLNPLQFFCYEFSQCLHDHIPGSKSIDALFWAKQQYSHWKEAGQVCWSSDLPQMGNVVPSSRALCRIILDPERIHQIHSPHHLGLSHGATCSIGTNSAEYSCESWQNLHTVCLKCMHIDSAASDGAIH